MYCALDRKRRKLFFLLSLQDHDPNLGISKHTPHPSARPESRKAIGILQSLLLPRHSSMMPLSRGLVAVRTPARGHREACCGLKIWLFHPHDFTKTQNSQPVAEKVIRLMTWQRRGVHIGGDYTQVKLPGTVPQAKLESTWHEGVVAPHLAGRSKLSFQDQFHWDRTKAVLCRFASRETIVRLTDNASRAYWHQERHARGGFS
jgi:hypothetical protein